VTNGSAGTRRSIGVGLVGTAWITRAHAQALHTINRLAPLSHEIRLVNIYGRRPETTERMASDFGVRRWTNDWSQLLDDTEVDVVANLATNALHEPVSIAALKVGKPVLCEKPLAPDAPAAGRMADAAEATGLPNACGFSYRFAPAVRLFHDLRASGRFGDLHHFRGMYLQDGIRRPAGGETGRSGSVLDFSHLLDMLRHLAGEPRTVSAVTSRLVSESDDCYAAILQLEGPAMATLEASRIATGWKGRQRIELNGSEGSAWWNLEDMNRLHVMLRQDAEEGLGGFRDVLVTEPEHPFLQTWWPPGHGLGWEHSFVHQWLAFLRCVLGGDRDPHLATFRDGHRAAVIADAIFESDRTGARVDVPLAGSAGA
jgi:predicted dehydrogenase